MRVNPEEEVLKSDQAKRRYQRRIDRITRIVAIVVAGLSTFSFILKIVFF
ncbi:hypothetical protein [Mucilaginibacter hurinus]|nr:hypothetical protein [Mucilaginibacter hurinus]